MCAHYEGPPRVRIAYQVQMVLEETGQWRLVTWWRNNDQDWSNKRCDRYPGLSFDELSNVCDEFTSSMMAIAERDGATQTVLDLTDADPF